MFDATRSPSQVALPDLVGKARLRIHEEIHQIVGDCFYDFPLDEPFHQADPGIRKQASAWREPPRRNTRDLPLDGPAARSSFQMKP